MINGWIDSHAHLCEDEFKDDFFDVINRAQSSGVRKIMVIACSIKQGYQALKLCETYEMIDIAVGLHPEDADSVNEATYQQLETLLKTGKFSAIGEIGLDNHWRNDNKQIQNDVFINQIKLANKYSLPIFIHSRDAANDTFNILKQYPAAKAGIMHCYSGSVEMAQEYLKLGYYISLAGPVTFKNAVMPKAVAQAIPITSLLIETDCPFMAPVPMRGKRNEPSFVVYVGEEICRLKGITSTEFIEQININYQHLFKAKV